MQINYFYVDSRVELQAVCLNILGKLSEHTKVYFNSVEANIAAVSFSEDDATTYICFSWLGISGWNYGDSIRLVDGNSNSELAIISGYGNGFSLDESGNKVYV